jgi:hypothetical protein
VRPEDRIALGKSKLQMPKKLRTLSSRSALEPMLVTPAVLGSTSLSRNERTPQRYVAPQSFTVRKRTEPQRITSFASRRRNK